MRPTLRRACLTLLPIAPASIAAEGDLARLLGAKLATLTNLRSFPDPGSSTGWSIEVDPFPDPDEVSRW